MSTRILAPRSRRPTKAQLTELLLGLGFERLTVRGSHISFRRGEAAILLPRTRTLGDAYIAATGFQLVQRGLISQDKWDRWVRGR